MTDNLADWLLEQIAEDERIGQEVQHQRADEDNMDGGWHLWGRFGLLVNRMADPKRWLAECDAKRRIVALHPVAAFPTWSQIYDDAGVFQTQRPTGGTAYSCPVCDDYYDGGTEYHSQPGCPTLRALALPYADREGYREEWKP